MRLHIPSYIRAFQSHRIHLLSLQTALQPSILTRVLIMVLQVIYMFAISTLRQSVFERFSFRLTPSIIPIHTHQAIVLPIYFSICLVYPPMCHSVAKMIDALAVRL